MTKLKSSVASQKMFDTLRNSKIGIDNNGVVVLSNEYFDTTRWSIIWRIVWSEKVNGETIYFAYFYEVDELESQKGTETVFDSGDIFRVQPIEVTTTKWVKVKEENEVRISNLTSEWEPNIWYEYDK